MAVSPATLSLEPSLSPRFARISATLFGFLIAVCAYWNALDGVFLWDDYSIVPALAAENRASLPEAFLEALTGSFWGQVASYYRPITTLSYLIDEALYGTSAAGFHLTNILLHAVNTALVIGLLLRLQSTTRVALGVGLLFGFMPRLTEAVAWISGRTDVLALFWSLLAFHSWLSERRAWRAISGLFFVLALLSKEVAIVTLAIPLLATGPGKSLRETFHRATPLALGLGVYLALRGFALQGTKVEYLPLGIGGRIQLGLEACARYACSLLTPWAPETLQGYWLAPHPYLWVLGAALALGVLSLGVLKGRELAPETRLGALIFIGALGLVLNLLPIPIVTIASDRFLYFPTFGLCLVTVGMLGRIQRRLPLEIGVYALALGFFVATWCRSADYGDDALFWYKANKTASPVDATAHSELSRIYARAGLYRESLLLSTSRRDADPTRQAELLVTAAQAQVYLGNVPAALALTESGCIRARSALCRGFALALAAQGNIDAAMEALTLQTPTRLTRSLQTSLAELRGLPQGSSRERFYFAAAADARGEALTRARELWLDSERDQTLRRDIFEYQLRFLEPSKLPELWNIAAPELQTALYRGIFEERRARAARLTALFNQEFR